MPRMNRSRSASASRNNRFLNSIQPNTSDHSQNTSDASQKSYNKFEVNMYTTMMSNAIAPTRWFYNMYIQSTKTTEISLSSSLEITFPLDSGASISVLQLPTYLIIAKMYDISSSDPLNSSKTLTIANESEVPIKPYETVTCYTSISESSRLFTIPFAVADIKYNILGTP